MDNQASRADLHEPGLAERSDQSREMVGKQGEQVVVADIAGGNHEQPSRLLAKQMAVTEVTILRDDHSVLGIRQGSERGIGRPVPVGKLRSLSRVVTGGAQKPRELRRQLRVD